MSNNEMMRNIKDGDLDMINENYLFIYYVEIRSKIREIPVSLFHKYI